MYEKRLRDIQMCDPAKNKNKSHIQRDIVFVHKQPQRRREGGREGRREGGREYVSDSQGISLHTQTPNGACFEDSETLVQSSYHH